MDSCLKTVAVHELSVASVGGFDGASAVRINSALGGDDWPEANIDRTLANRERYCFTNTTFPEMSDIQRPLRSSP